MSFYDFTAETLDGKPAPLSDWKGKVVLIVNTASKCGFTPQYKGLEELYRKYRDRGLVVLGFPCNQFGAQEPGDEEEIKSFCSLTYDVHERRRDELTTQKNRGQAAVVTLAASSE